MTGRKLPASTRLGPLLALMLCAGVASIASAATEPTDTATASASRQAPVEDLVQLDEIQVRGKRLARTIEDAEDDFFQLYNALNKDNNYDVTCGDMRLNGSLVIQRTCIPGFLANYVMDQNGIATSGCARTSLGPVAVSSPAGNGNELFYVDPCPGSRPRLVTVSADALAFHHRARYAATVVRVVKSDPRLLQKAATLTTLYQEMEQVQGRYKRVRESR